MIDHWLTRTLQVWRPVATDDGAGGQAVELYRLADVPAKVDQPSAADRMLAAQAGSAHTHTVYLNASADVLRGDELRGGGQVFRVLAVSGPSRPDYLKADTELIQTEGV